MCNLFEDYNSLFLETMKLHLPCNINAAGFLMETLNIERSAAYRRLRGEILFTFNEASLIARKLDMYMDQIVIKDRYSKVIPFRLSVIEFYNPDEVDYQILEEHIAMLQLARQDPTSRMTISVNMLPQQIYIQYDNLLKYFFFKGAYYVNKERKAYHDIEIPERMRQVFKRSSAEHVQFKATCFIFDKFLFQYMVNDLQYFYSIGLIKNEDLKIIVEELYDVIDYLEQICISGKYKNGNDVQVYISSLNFDKSCYTYEVCNYRISMIEACVLNGIGTTDMNSFDMISDWIESRRTMSINITQCEALYRSIFFKEQKKILSMLQIP